MCVMYVIKEKCDIMSEVFEWVFMRHLLEQYAYFLFI